jgi:hypothetical protein
VGRVAIYNYGVNGPPYDPTRKPNAILGEAELYPHSDSIAAELEFEYININNSWKSGIVFECMRSSDSIEFQEYVFKLKEKITHDWYPMCTEPGGQTVACLRLIRDEPSVQDHCISRGWFAFDSYEVLHVYRSR